MRGFVCDLVLDDRLGAIGEDGDGSSGFVGVDGVTGEVEVVVGGGAELTVGVLLPSLVPPFDLAGEPTITGSSMSNQSVSGVSRAGRSFI